MAERHANEVHVLKKILEPVNCKYPLRCGGFKLDDNVEKQDILAATMRRLQRLNDSLGSSKISFLVDEFLERKKPNVQHPFKVRDFEQNINTQTCGRSLCQPCFAATFDMLQANGTYKTSWAEARSRFCETGNLNPLL